MVWYGIKWYSMVSHGITWYRMDLLWIITSWNLCAWWIVFATPIPMLDSDNPSCLLAGFCQGSQTGLSQSQSWLGWQAMSPRRSSGEASEGRFGPSGEKATTLGEAWGRIWSGFYNVFAFVFTWIVSVTNGVDLNWLFSGLGCPKRLPEASWGSQIWRNIFFHQVAPPSKKQLKYFSNTNNSTILTLSGPPGVSREAKLSTEFEFGSLVR